MTDGRVCPNKDVSLLSLPLPAVAVLAALVAEVVTSSSLRQTCCRARDVFPPGSVLNLAGRRDSLVVVDRAPSSIVHLDLSFSNVGDGAVLSSLLHRFPNLTTLVLDGCCDLRRLDTTLLPSSLREASFYWTPLIDDDFVVSLVSSSPNLTSLNLSGAKRLTNVAVLAISRQLRLLRHLNLTKLINLTDRSLIALSSLSSLITVNLYACSSFTSIGISRLAKSTPMLADLDLCGGQFVTDDAIEAIASSCPQLRRLNLTWCVLLTDRALIALGRLHHLAWLSLFGVGAVTDVGIKAISGRRLRFLDLNGCSLVTKAVKDQIRDLFPFLRDGLAPL